MQRRIWLESWIPRSIVLAIWLSFAQAGAAATLSSPVSWGSPDQPWGQRRAVTAADRSAIAAYRSGHKAPIFATNFTSVSELQSDWSAVSDDNAGNQSCRRPGNIESSTAGLRLKTLLANGCRARWSTGYVASKATYAYGFFEARIKIGDVMSAGILPGTVQAGDVLRGVNFVRPIQFSLEEQNAKLNELQAAGVQVIRFGMYAQDKDKNLDFIKRAQAHHISTVLILHGLYTPGAPERRLNKHTPLLPTSLVDIEQEGPWPTPKPYDGVSVLAAIAFFRAHGLDRLVDAYNLHTYPWGDRPGDKTSAIHRMRRLGALVDPICGTNGKPCWITEWGFAYASKACPASEERDHALLVQEMIGDFTRLAKEGRLTGLIYYSWTGDGQFDLTRCGSISDAGRQVLAPF